MKSDTPKFTPGPWKWCQESVDPCWAVVTSEGGNVVANVNSETGPDIPPLVSIKMPQHANAALIATAPTMYADLRIIRDYLYKLYEDGNMQAGEYAASLDTTIAQAEGNS